MMMHHDMGGGSAQGSLTDSTVRRLIFLGIKTSGAANPPASLFAINSERTPLFFIDVDIHSLALLDYRDYRDPESGAGDRRFLAALSVSLPVWDGLKRIEERRAARARAEEARARAELLRREIALQALEAGAEVSISLERRDAARMQRAASEEALRLALARYRAGLISQTDLLAADSEAARARLNAVNSEVDAVVAQYRNRHAMGALE